MITITKDNKQKYNAKIYLPSWWIRRVASRDFKKKAWKDTDQSFYSIFSENHSCYVALVEDEENTEKKMKRSSPIDID